jgi:hypothetical protein
MSPKEAKILELMRLPTISERREVEESARDRYALAALAEELDEANEAITKTGGTPGLWMQRAFALACIHKYISPRSLTWD